MSPIFLRTPIVVRLLLYVALTICSASQLPAVEIAGVDLDALSGSLNTEPRGKYVEVTVPDTLDLAERGGLAVHALTSFLNPSHEYSSYGQNFLNANPAYLSHFDMGPPNWGANIESLVMARQMSGSRENLDVDRLTIAGMLKDAAARDPKIPSAIDLCRIGTMALYQVDSKPELIAVFDELARREAQAVNRVEGKGAYYWDPQPDLQDSMLGVIRHGWTPFVSGLAIHSLSRWSQFTKQEDDYLLLCGELATFARQPKYWQPEASPKAVVGFERAQFDGHHHSYLTLLKGLLCYAEQTNDVQLMCFVRDGYEYFRTFGLARIGAFGETCSTGDMTFLAIKLSDLGVGDYWDDADQYIRNQLAETQITDAATLHRLASQLPHGRGKSDFTKGPFNPDIESTENAIDRSVGAFLSDSSHPTLIPESCLLYTICCTGSCVPALYAAWDATVRSDGDTAQINLLFNRSAESLDVDSYLPYEGKVVIQNKTARRIAVRIPLWVDWNSIKCQIDGQDVVCARIGRYCIFENMKPKSELNITFPIAETQETWTLKWKEKEFWQECTNPGSNWQPLETPKQYTMRFRGNTLVDIEPRDTSLGMPLYVRDHLQRDAAPMKKITRFVPALTIDW
jgi:hypothetical protein